MYLLCGLGNPGKKYSLTRHNIGFRIVDKIILEYKFEKFKFDKTKEVYRGEIKNISGFIIKPISYMNLSGIPVASFCNFYKLNKKNIIVIHDDLDIKLGKIKVKNGGNNGGHKGLMSIDNHLGIEYNRLRFGIGHPGLKQLVDNYVLEKFNSQDELILEKLINLIVKNISFIIKGQKDLFLTKIYKDISNT